MSTIRRSVSAIPGARRTGLAALRGLTTATMLFGSVAVGISSASAQADEDEGTYESPTFGYTLEWNADDWTVEDESEADNNGGRDFLYLFDQDATTQLYAEGSEDSWDDPEDCVSTLLDELNVDPDDGEVVEDADGEDIETSDDDRAAAAYLCSRPMTTARRTIASRSRMISSSTRSASPTATATSSLASPAAAS